MTEKHSRLMNAEFRAEAASRDAEIESLRQQLADVQAAAGGLSQTPL